MKTQTKAWLDVAKADLQTIQHIINDEHLTGVAVFHAQQCVEKSFKAILIENNNALPKIHDLSKLFSLIEKLVKLKLNFDLLETLNEVYMDSRYPIDLGLLPEGKPSLVRARELYGFAKDVFNQVEKQLKTNK